MFFRDGEVQEYDPDIDSTDGQSDVLLEIQYDVKEEQSDEELIEQIPFNVMSRSVLKNKKGMLSTLYLTLTV